VELWGEGEALEKEKIEEVAGDLYGFSPEEVMKALFSNIRNGAIKGRFYIEGPAQNSRKKTT
jgi:hypothetical protein